MRVAALNDIHGNLRTDYDVDAAVASMRETSASISEQVLDWLLDPRDPSERTVSIESQRGA